MDYTQPALTAQPQGVLSFFNDPSQATMLGLATGLLQAGGPSRIPVSLGQGLAAGVSQAQQNQGVMLQRQLMANQLRLTGAQATMAEQNARLMGNLPAMLGQPSSGAVPQGTPGPTPPGLSASTSQLAFGTPQYATGNAPANQASPDWRQAKAAEFRATADRYSSVLAQNPQLIAMPVGQQMQKSVQDYYNMANQLDPTPTYGRIATVIGPDGKPVAVQPSSRGGAQPVQGYSPLPNIRPINQGNQITMMDLNQTVPGTSVPIGISPAAVFAANNARAIHNSTLLANDPIASMGGGAPVGTMPMVGPSGQPAGAPAVAAPSGAAAPAPAGATAPAPTASKPAAAIPAPDPKMASIPGVLGITADMHGQQVLDQLPVQLAQQVKALAEGRQQIPAGFALKSPYWQRMIGLVAQYDPTFDQVNYNARSATRRDFTSGQSGKSLNALNTVIGHLDSLDAAGKALNNSGVPYYNMAANYVAANLSPDFRAKLNQFNLTKQAVSSEMERAYRGTGGNMADIASWQKTLSDADSYAAIHASIQQAVKLLSSKVDALGATYDKGMGTTGGGLALLDPKARDVYLSYLGEGPGTPQAGASTAGAPSVPPQAIVDEMRRRGLVK